MVSLKQGGENGIASQPWLTLERVCSQSIPFITPTAPDPQHPAFLSPKVHDDAKSAPSLGQAEGGDRRTVP